MTSTKQKRSQIRCPWATEHELLQQYHDEEWGVFVPDEHQQFEMLILESAQAGLNWLTILKKREHYRRLFRGFNPEKIVRMQAQELEMCLKDTGIIRNRLKIYSVPTNAKVFIAIQKEFGSFVEYILQCLGHQNRAKIPISRTTHEVPSETEASKKIAQDLKQRGMTFVGSKIIYAYMQASGFVNGHTIHCFRYYAGS